MVDRDRVLNVLTSRFPEAPPAQIAATANAIVGLDDDWEDVTAREPDLGYHSSPRCSRICFLAQQVDEGDSFRLLRRRARR